MASTTQITSHRDGQVTALSVAPGQAVTAGQIVCVVSQDDA